MNTHVILVRHGQSTFNAEKRFQGCSDDSVLTEQGRLTAYQTGVALSNVGFDAAYVSPLRRTQETAEELLSTIASIAPNPVQLHVHPDLVEIDLPAWQGLPYQYVREKFVEDYNCWKEQPHTFQMAIPPMATQYLSANRAPMSAIATLDSPPTLRFPVQDLFERARRFWQEILPRHRGERILVVSHGGTIRALISTAIALDSSQYHTLQQSNGGISHLAFPGENRQSAHLNALNLTNHLGESLPKLKDGKQGLRLLLLPVGWQTYLQSKTLARALSSVPLDFCITEDSVDAELVADEILLSRFPRIVQLSVSQQNFLHAWHQTIHVRPRNVAALSTGLVITKMETIETALHQILQLPEGQRSLHLQPGTLSVLYYPDSANYPVLQTMNLNAA
jgi:probable phosphoglycerate mutase